MISNKYLLSVPYVQYTLLNTIIIMKRIKIVTIIRPELNHNHHRYSPHCHLFISISMAVLLVSL